MTGAGAIGLGKGVASGHGTHDHGADDHEHAGHGHDHGLESSPGHVHDDEPVDAGRMEEIRDAIWATDNVELTTVGVDIGSATSHLMFSRLHLRRQGDAYSSRFRVVSRRVLDRSEIRLTPYAESGLIDAEALRTFIDAAYRKAGLVRADIDAGAVILTGVALERANARAIAELFAAEGGRFVCATAGHNLEALLAAHGSGAVALSRSAGTVLNVDVGGGTTKLAWCQDGQVVSTMAIAGGARLLAVDDAGRATRVEQDVLPFAIDIGLDLQVGQAVVAADRRRLAERIAERITDAVAGRVAGLAILAGEHPGALTPGRVVMSGGVAEYLGAETARRFGDLGPDLAAALVRRLADEGLEVEPSGERIRATVIGASQFSVQLSGNTVHLSGALVLPVHGVPVVAVEIPDDPFPDAATIQALLARRARLMDVEDRDATVAVSLRWDGEPVYHRLRAIAEAVAGAHRASARRDTPVVLALQADIGASLGAILEQELGMDTGVIAIDGLDLVDLDYIDIGERILPANVVPVVVKSLVFPTPVGGSPDGTRAA